MGRVQCWPAGHVCQDWNGLTLFGLVFVPEVGKRAWSWLADQLSWCVHYLMSQKYQPGDPAGLGGARHVRIKGLLHVWWRKMQKGNLGVGDCSACLCAAHIPHLGPQAAVGCLAHVVHDSGQAQMFSCLVWPIF